MSTSGQAFKSYAAILLTFFVLDATWISFVAVKQFEATIGNIMRPAPLMAPVVIFYLIYCAGLLKLAVAPALFQRSMPVAASSGGLLGLVAYATFDLSNLAIIQGWTTALAVVDIAWGTILSAVAATVGYAVGVRRKS